jgi:hypothetical protein
MAIILDGPLTPDEGTLIVRNIPTPTDAAALDAFLPDVYDESLEFDFTSAEQDGQHGPVPCLRRAGAHQPARPAHDQPGAAGAAVGLQAGGRRAGAREALRPGLRQRPEAALAQRRLRRPAQPGARRQAARRSRPRAQVLSTGTLVDQRGRPERHHRLRRPVGATSSPPRRCSRTPPPTSSRSSTRARGVHRAQRLRARQVAVVDERADADAAEHKLQKMAVQTYGNGAADRRLPGLVPQSTRSTRSSGNYNMPNPTQYICDARVSVDGTSTLVLPSNVVVLGPPDDQPLGKMQWGPTVTGQKLAAEGALDLAPAASPASSGSSTAATSSPTRSARSSTRCQPGRPDQRRTA